MNGDAPQHEPQWIDGAISNLLRAGVVISMVVVITGLVFTFIHHPQYVRSKSALGRLTDAGAAYPRRLRDVATHIAEGRGQAIVMLGLLMLIGTPVARVAFAIVAFAIERDRLYVMITTIVLVLLLVPFLIGAAE
jgi:uncharacterized membrane protein